MFVRICLWNHLVLNFCLLGVFKLQIQLAFIISLFIFSIYSWLSSVQSLSCVWLFMTPWTAAHQASLSITNSWSLLKLTSTESVMSFNHLILCCPLLLLPSLFPRIRVFSSELALCIKRPKYWSCSFSISTSNKYSGLISFRIDWFVILAIQRTLMSLLQHQFKSINSLALSFRYSPTLTSIHDYWENHSFNCMDLCLQSNVSTFNMLSRLSDFLPRSKHIFISWMQSPSAVILEPPKRMSVSVFIVSPSICHEVMGPDAMIFVFWMLSFKPAFSLSSFTFIKRFFSYSSLSAIRVVTSAYLKLLIFLLETLILAFVTVSLEFRMMYSAYKLNKEGNNIQPLHTPFPI